MVDHSFPAPLCGVDEAGRGPLAGPVVAAAVILPAQGIPVGINDSKKLTEKTRARLCAEIRACAVVGIGVVEPEEIDRLNIYWATMKAMTLAVDAVVETLGQNPAHVLVDGNKLPQWDYRATAIVGGDAKSLAIGAASIVAKHVRDDMMIAAAETYPAYGWHSNKGYGSTVHLAALREHGPTPLHRRSFAPVAQCYLDL
ncbi:ribonuclease HII [uncultured Sphingomonas sp.]|uniref:ribonuclease HII n=1 Tax=uncultured Sphingomonas sp. TaxID=158754 RepID=UPI0025FA3BB6|nr:ribonuclease HII [uncultured Sphingomonas sp.]